MAIGRAILDRLVSGAQNIMVSKAKSHRKEGTTLTHKALDKKDKEV